ncbi:hypothetical protein ABIC65_003938 [Sphingomonas trueperi]|uniref:hypothetical protein n=1 Tax=Sphingomonas trueperi TaxID=53317 RepID=UPI003394C5CE
MSIDTIPTGLKQSGEWERDRYLPLPIDPFGATPHFASRLTGLGGDRPPPNPAYVLETNPVRAAVGPIVFTVEIDQLRATAGTLVLHVLARPAHLKTDLTPVATIAVSMADLIAHNGVACIGTIGRRNMLYSVTAELSDESDATASAIRVSLNRREESDPDWQPRDVASKLASLPQRGPALRDKPELISMQSPLLMSPVSQVMTARQFAEPVFAARMADLDQQGGRGELQAWEDAIILQALRYYGALSSGAPRGLCFDRAARALPAYVASQGGSMTVIRDGLGSQAGDDSGDGLGPLHRPSVCTPKVFESSVHLATAATLARGEEVADYDFLWSRNISDTVESKAAFPHFLLDSMRYLRFGGIAIHLLRYGTSQQANPAAGGGPIHFSRPEIERLALSLVAQAQEVAQLKFAIQEIGASELNAPIPFAILARRTC